ncbi:MAG: 4-alpha-glucanotransferase [Gammaproteobacteria bacterium]
MSNSPTVLDRRRAGILLHVTSLPDGYGNGDMGHAAYRFIEFLEAVGVSVWQMLPLGPTHADGSPYQSFSIHAGNPLLISLDWLVDRGWLDQRPVPPIAESPAAVRRRCLDQAFLGFSRYGAKPGPADYQEFLHKQGYWLPDYALYVALKEAYAGKSWQDWPEALRMRSPEALRAATDRLQASIERIQFEQFVFFSQWAEIKAYANRRGIFLFGDMPIFVAEDSADVWVHQDCFDLDEKGRPRTVAGVPPDYFSATGQRWGNPQYKWKHLEEQGFTWWLERMKTQLALFDWIRIDHFRGFEAYWEIPASEETAIKGRWVKAPGDSLLTRIRETFDHLPLIAEDLGIVTPEVEELRDRYDLPGMKILQFAFDSDAKNPYLPHNHIPNCVVYTGTHDNDTSAGWAESLNPEQQARIRDYSGCDRDPLGRLLMRAALASVARLAVLPMQDVLELGAGHRMNIPGTRDGNWQWRFSWSQLGADKIARLKEWIRLYGRSPS